MFFYDSKITFLAAPRRSVHVDISLRRHVLCRMAEIIDRIRKLIISDSRLEDDLKKSDDFSFLFSARLLRVQCVDTCLIL
jgi:hypothetical protein